MIENVPSADELRTISLRLYFKAWADLSEIVTEWERYSGLEPPKWSPERGHFYIETVEDAEKNDAAEWRQYLEAAQSDLQGIYTLIQQSQEIGIKARICDISSFLLLKRTDVRPSDPATNTWDFTDFPTVDASELVKVHNTFCSTVLTKEFQAQYDQIRRNRNKIAHLGIYNQPIDPHSLFDILKMQYTELYPDRRWMADRLHFATLHRWSDYSGNDFNERTSLFEELWLLLPGFSDDQFKWLMGHPREATRYICHSCADDVCLGGQQPYDNDVPTAFRVNEGMEVRCVVCDETYAIKAGHCARDDCHCKLLSAEDASLDECMECGWSEEDVKQEREREEKQQADLVAWRQKFLPSQ